jgi:DNA-binding transcriptional MerR regulator
MALIVDKKRSIGEAAREIGVPEHVLRFWEKEFVDYIKPSIGNGGRRYYYNDNITVLLTIKKYLYENGYTIKGLNNLFKNNRIDLLDKGVHIQNAQKENIGCDDINKTPPQQFSQNNNIKFDLRNLKYKLNNFYEKLKDT